MKPGRSRLISGKAKLAGVVGWPVGHSLSPALHGYWLDQYGIDGAYVPLAVLPENFKRAVFALPDLGFRGFNVTIPYKEKILPLLAGADGAALRLRAVNTVVVSENGKLHGFNSDGFGFTQSLTETRPGWEYDLTHAVILGAGGAARAVAFALLGKGVNRITVSNRTTARTGELMTLLRKAGADCAAVAFPPLPSDFEGAGLLVNTTSLGMAGQPPLDVALDGLKAGALVADIVYNPLETALLAQARAQGLQPVNGLGMLLHQARAGFERWFGVRPEVTAEQRSMMEGLLAQRTQKR